MWPIRVLLIASGLTIPVAAQQMPYSLAWVYTSAPTETGDGRVSATTVANTYGTSGHTAAAAVWLKRPDDSYAAANMYLDYMSQATTYIDMCSGSSCWDGTYVASSDGTTEYCPIALQYVTPAVVQQSQQVQPFIKVMSVSFNPTSIERTNSTTTFLVGVVKSQSCSSTGVQLQMGLLNISGTPSYSYAPNSVTQGAAFGSGVTTSASWSITTSESNQSPGTVAGTGLINDNYGTCNVPDGLRSKEASPSLTIR
jgi:hypothetical protein